MSMNYYVNDRFCCYPRPLTPAEDQCYNDNDQCTCSHGMGHVLEAIMATVYNMQLPDFEVCLEVTTTTGVLYTIPVSTSVSKTVEITESMLITDQIIISICDIAKIHINPGNIQASKFDHMIQEALKELTLTKTFGAALNSVTFSTISSDVVDTICSTGIPIVTTVDLSNSDVVTQLAESIVTVSAPIMAAITPIVSQITTITPDHGVITHIDTTTTDVLEKIKTFTKDGVTGFENSKSITGVISGVKSISTTTPKSFDLPSISCPNMGAMQVTLPIGIIDGVNPTHPIVLNVQVGSENVSYGGNRQIFALTSNEKLLSGIKGNPTTSDLSLIGTPITDPFIYDVKSTVTPVLHSIDSKVTEGSLIESISADIVNTIATPTTIDVLEKVSPITKNLTTINSIGSITPDKLFTISTKKMLESASLDSTSAKFVKEIL